MKKRTEYFKPILVEYYLDETHLVFFDEHQLGLVRIGIMQTSPHHDARVLGKNCCLRVRECKRVPIIVCHPDEKVLGTIDNGRFLKSVSSERFVSLESRIICVITSHQVIEMLISYSRYGEVNSISLKRRERHDMVFFKDNVYVTFRKGKVQIRRVYCEITLRHGQNEIITGDVVHTGPKNVSALSNSCWTVENDDGRKILCVVGGNPFGIYNYLTHDLELTGDVHPISPYLSLVRDRAGFNYIITGNTAAPLKKIRDHEYFRIFWPSDIGFGECPYFFSLRDRVPFYVAEIPGIIREIVNEDLVKILKDRNIPNQVFLAELRDRIILRQKGGAGWHYALKNLDLEKDYQVVDNQLVPLDFPRRDAVSINGEVIAGSLDFAFTSMIMMSFLVENAGEYYLYRVAKGKICVKPLKITGQPPLLVKKPNLPITLQTCPEIQYCVSSWVVCDETSDPLKIFSDLFLPRVVDEVATICIPRIVYRGVELTPGEVPFRNLLAEALRAFKKRYLVPKGLGTTFREGAVKELFPPFDGTFTMGHVIVRFLEYLLQTEERTFVCPYHMPVSLLAALAYKGRQTHGMPSFPTESEMRFFMKNMYPDTEDKCLSASFVWDRKITGYDPEEVREIIPTILLIVTKNHSLPTISYFLSGSWKKSITSEISIIRNEDVRVEYSPTRMEPYTDPLVEKIAQTLDAITSGCIEKFYKRVTGSEFYPGGGITLIIKSADHDYLFDRENYTVYLGENYLTSLGSHDLLELCLALTEPSDPE